MSQQNLVEELERLRAENESLKRKASGPMSLRVTDKGGVSLYGLGRFPVSLYKNQWEKLLMNADAIRAFLAEHESELTVKP